MKLYKESLEYFRKVCSISFGVLPLTLFLIMNIIILVQNCLVSPNTNLYFQVQVNVIIQPHTWGLYIDMSKISSHCFLLILAIAIKVITYSKQQD